MSRVLPIVVALLLVIVSGLAHGFWTARWQTSQALEEALERVPQVLLRFGDWEGQPVAAEAGPFAQAGAQAYWMRQYRHRKTGVTVSAILMCGRAGPLSVHTPDVCYRGAGYELQGSPVRFTVPSGGDEAAFWSGDFSKGVPGVAGGLRLFWGWSADGRWLAPDNPRFTFRGQPALCKLYVARETGSSSEPLREDPAVTFLEQFLPELQHSLFPREE